MRTVRCPLPIAAPPAGLGSIFAAFRRPDVLGNVLSQSGAIWPDHVRGGPTPGGGPSILACNRRLRDVLPAKGYPVQYAEVAGAHVPLSWRGGARQGPFSKAAPTRA